MFMRIQYKILSVLILVGIVLVSGCSQEKASCAKSGGKWRVYSNNCEDKCIFVRGHDIGCADVMTSSCDCGSEKCWTGEVCEAN